MGISIPIIGSLIDGVVSIFKGKEERKKIKTQSSVDRLMAADNKVAEWERIQAEGSKSSWKDEFWTIILSIPLIMCFIPPLTPYVKAGFVVLESMPEYYRYWLGLAIAAAFAVRQLKK